MKHHPWLVGTISFFLFACGGGADPTGPRAAPVSAEAGADSAQCSGVLPSTCEVCSNGVKGCAHWEVVDGKCTVEFCPPSPPSSPTCSGTLPGTCEVCSDGGKGCAHWGVVNGQCMVEFCD